MNATQMFLPVLLFGLLFSNCAGASESVKTAQFALRSVQVAKGNSQGLSKLQTLANGGDVMAQLKLATMYYSGQGAPQRYVQTLKRKDKPAEKSHATAKNNLGLMYTLGKSVPQNYAEAWKWKHKPAEKSHAMAKNNLGLMYTLGKSVPQNYAEAWKWKHKLAEKSHAMAKNNPGTRYGRYRVVQQNYAEALKWALIAKAEGDHDANHDVSIIENKATPAQIANGQGMAHRWWAINHLRH